MRGRFVSGLAAVLAFLSLVPLARGQRLLPGPERNTLAAPPNGLGSKKMAAVLFNFADSPVQPISTADTRRQLFTDADSTNAFVNEVSFGQLRMIGHLRADGDVFGWYTLPLTGSPNDKSTPSRVQEINRMAQANGFNPANYDVIFYIHPFMNTGWAGQAYGGSARKEIEMDGMNRVAAAHEMFHILGIDHANGLRCTQNGSPVAIADDFTSVGYADPFDQQGANPEYRHPNAYFKARMGWFMTHNFLTVSSRLNRTYTFRIKPIERPSPGLLCVRIPIPRNRIPLQFGWGADPTTVDLFYYLEYRQSSSFDAYATTDPVVNGVSIRLGTDIDTNHMTLLVDTTPETSSFADAPLTVGRTFRDPVAGVRILTLAASPAEATVEVSVDAGETLSQGPHLLWSRTDGMASLWTLDAGGNYLRHRYYGPIPHMTAMDYQRVNDSVAKLLWGRSDGMAILWTLDECDNIVSIDRYGPFHDWTPRSYYKLSDDTARLLWSRTDGMASIWTLNASDDYLTYKYIGPYPTWTAKHYQRLSDGRAKLLWNRNDGLVSIWNLDGSDDYLSHREHGPFYNWTANGYDSEGTNRIVWARTDGLGSVWTLDSNDGYVTYRYHGPFINWTARAYSQR